mmetsp:Transcript_40773/g.80340  ORF Transcript_40773/g.80340 Transcript_40773/m.80340 type:complete len:213 (+) Transcript_40773:91-729(+)
MISFSFLVVSCLPCLSCFFFFHVLFSSCKLNSTVLTAKIRKETRRKKRGRGKVPRPEEDEEEEEKGDRETLIERKQDGFTHKVASRERKMEQVCIHASMPLYLLDNAKPLRHRLSSLSAWLVLRKGASACLSVCLRVRLSVCLICGRAGNCKRMQRGDSKKDGRREGNLSRNRPRERTLKKENENKQTGERRNELMHLKSGKNMHFLPYTSE